MALKKLKNYCIPVFDSAQDSIAYTKLMSKNDNTYEKGMGYVSNRRFRCTFLPRHEGYEGVSCAGFLFTDDVFMVLRYYLDDIWVEPPPEEKANTYYRLDGVCYNILGAEVSGWVWLPNYIGSLFEDIEECVT